MAKNLSPVLLLITLSLLLPSINAAHLTHNELFRAISALRSHGYTLFPNAIATSDLHNRLVSLQNSTFTLFSPPDSLLSALDFSSRSLFYHVAPLKLATSHLLKLSFGGGSYIDTLLPHRRLLIGNTQVSVNETVSDSVTVDGVRVSAPDLFTGSGIAVHGLDGILVAGFESEDDEEDYASDHHLRFLSPPASCPNQEILTPAESSVVTTHVSSSNKRKSRQGSGGKTGHGKFSKTNHRFGL